MGIADWFNVFCSRLRMNDDMVESIRYRYKRITRQLNIDFRNNNSDTANSLYVGSYGRGTAIHVSDIDMLIQLPYEKYAQYNSYIGNGQSALLQEVKRSIENTYNSYIRADGQVVKVDFTDGVSFEIVPVFINRDQVSFTYPDTNNGGSWKTTNPRKEINEINSANNLWNKNLKRLCRMARAWKDNCDVPIGGLLIDTLAYNFMKNWQYRNESFYYYDLMSRDFFEYLKNQNKLQSYWLAPGSNQRVYRKGIFENKALSCYNLTLQAIGNERNGNEWSAKQKWRDIYGTKFPG